MLFLPHQERIQEGEKPFVVARIWSGPVLAVTAIALAGRQL
jgi:hypothetical protein